MGVKKVSPAATKLSCPGLTNVKNRKNSGDNRQAVVFYPVALEISPVIGGSGLICQDAEYRSLFFHPVFFTGKIGSGE